MAIPKLEWNLRVLVALRALSVSNIQTAFFAVYLVHDLHASLALALQVYSSLGLLGALLEVPTGWFADWCGRKVSLILGCLCASCGLTLYATSTTVGLWLFTGAFIAYSGCSLLNGADSALAADICVSHYKKSEADLAFVHYETQAARFSGVAMATGSLVGLLLVWRLGLRATLWAQAMVGLPMLVCACVVKVPAYATTVKVASITCIIRSLRHRRRLVALFAASAAITAATNIAWKVVPLYYTGIRLDSRQLPVMGLGLLWAGFLGSQYLIRPSWPHAFKRRFGPYCSQVIIMAVGVVCYLVLGTTTSLAGLAMVFIIFIMSPLYLPHMQDRVRELSDPAERATIMSLNRTARYLAMSFGSLAISEVVSRAGLSMGMLTAGGLLGLFGTISLLFLFHADRCGPAAAANTVTVSAQS